MKLFALIIASGQYDEYTRTVMAITANKVYAQAWPLIGINKRDDSYEVDEYDLDVMDKQYLKALMVFLDTKANPTCECGHTLFEHSKRGKMKCIRNTPKRHEQPHACPGFRLQVLVPTPPLAPKIRLGFD